jgi:hypothetical protein
MDESPHRGRAGVQFTVDACEQGEGYVVHAGVDVRNQFQRLKTMNA